MPDDAVPPNEPAPEPAPEHERRDAAARAADLGRMAAANADATFGETGDVHSVVPGIVSGDLGPKGKVAAQLRALSRHERGVYGEVPRGTVASNGALLVLVPMLLIVLVLIAIVAVIFWLST